MRINDQSPEATIATEARTANLIASVAILEKRYGHNGDRTNPLDRIIRARLGLDEVSQ